jgi:hypothetical protein
MQHDREHTPTGDCRPVRVPMLVNSSSSSSSSLSANESRLNSLLARAEHNCQQLKTSLEMQSTAHHSRQVKLDVWSKKMYEKVDQIYASCVNDLKQSFQQLKSFQEIMLQILNSDQENYIDMKKLMAIEHEICILKCLTYQLDTSKVKIDGKLRLNKSLSNEQCGTLADVQSASQLESQYEQENRALPCRLLVHKDMIEKISSVPNFAESVQMTANAIEASTPERVLTIRGEP